MTLIPNARENVESLPFVPGAAEPAIIRSSLQAVAFKTGTRGQALINLLAHAIKDNQLLTAARLLADAPSHFIAQWGSAPETALFVDTAKRVLGNITSNHDPDWSSCKRLGVPAEDIMIGLRDLAVRSAAIWLINATGAAEWDVRPPVYGCLEFFSLRITLSPVILAPGHLMLRTDGSQIIARYESHEGQSDTLQVHPWPLERAPRYVLYDPDLTRAASYAVGRVEQLNNWRSLLTDSSEVLKVAAPNIARSPLLRAIIPLAQPAQCDGSNDAPDDGRIRPESLSLENVPGVLYVGLVKSARVFAEMLVHEITHQELFLLEQEIGQMWSGDAGTTLYSAWKDEPRPLRAVLHGICSFLAIAYFWSQWLPDDIVASIRFARALAQVELALEGLSHQPGATPATRALLECLAIRANTLADYPIGRSRWVCEAVLECTQHAAERNVPHRGAFIDRILNGV